MADIQGVSGVGSDVHGPANAFEVIVSGRRNRKLGARSLSSPSTPSSLSSQIGYTYKGLSHRNTNGKRQAIHLLLFYSTSTRISFPRDQRVWIVRGSLLCQRWPNPILYTVLTARTYTRLGGCPLLAVCSDRSVRPLPTDLSCLCHHLVLGRAPASLHAADRHGARAVQYHYLAHKNRFAS
jgi:hypothetical protein